MDADCLDFGPNRLCFIRVQDEFSACPRTFEAAQLASSPGLFHCLPTEGCCIDEDDDNHGQGVFCVGPDCDDDESSTRPGGGRTCGGLRLPECVDGSCVPAL
ncbi:MAG: hypothetical protein IPL19_06365 [Sandaracinaceae bacterium]|nr:hypothetical protein [Sandaracinaceae bacterium]